MKEYNVTIKDDNGVLQKFTVDEDMYAYIVNNSKRKPQTIGAYLRASLKTWREASSVFYYEKCVINGYKPYDIHHVHPYGKIKAETFENTGITTTKRKYAHEYTKDELKVLVDEILRLHNHYGLGVPLNRNHHQKFHEEFGRHNYTKEQTLEFIRRFNPEFVEFDYADFLSKWGNNG